MILDYAQSLTELAEQLIKVKFKRITSIASIMGVDSAKNFLDGIPASDMIISDLFPKHIPIIYENVSVKKFDYTLCTHVIFWLADGEPYIFTPTPTIGHTRHGMQYRKLDRDEYLCIPDNALGFDVLAVEQRCEHDHTLEDPSNYLKLSITRYKR